MKKADNPLYAFLPPLNRGKRGGAVAHVQDVIRDAIVRLDFAPGEVIDKAALCERLGVSRFPVSEALGRLADEGFIEILPQRGTRVTCIDLADCREAMFIRSALETETVRKIAADADDSLLSALKANIAQTRQAMQNDDRPAFHALDLALHDILIDALGYERVRASVHAARAKLDRMRLFLCTPARQVSTLAEHESIVAALARHDADAAAAAMETHLQTVMTELSHFLATRPEAFRNGGADGGRQKETEAA